MINRRLLREIALRSLYAYALDPESPEYTMNHVMGPLFREHPDLAKSPADKLFTENLFLKAIRLQEECERLITSKIENWELDRIALMDRLILRLGIVELLEFEDIPPRVTVNEAIELAKNFSTAKSGKFVNGVLDAILIDLKAAGRINKKGRGLIDMSSTKS
jgi:transcription antitermination protein NusB